MQASPCVKYDKTLHPTQHLGRPQRLLHQQCNTPIVETTHSESLSSTVLGKRLSSDESHKPKRYRLESHGLPSVSLHSSKVPYLSVHKPDTESLRVIELDSDRESKDSKAIKQEVPPSQDGKLLSQLLIAVTCFSQLSTG